MSYIDRSLVEGERVLYRARLHWVVLFWPILVASAIGALGVAFLVVVWLLPFGPMVSRELSAWRGCSSLSGPWR